MDAATALTVIAAVATLLVSTVSAVFAGWAKVEAARAKGEATKAKITAEVVQKTVDDPVAGVPAIHVLVNSNLDAQKKINEGLQSAMDAQRIEIARLNEERHTEAIAREAVVTAASVLASAVVPALPPPGPIAVVIKGADAPVPVVVREE